MRKATWIMRLFVLTALLTAWGCGTPKTVTIRYGAWNLGTPRQNGLERQMVKAFMSKYPNIRIRIDEDFVKNYDRAMKTAAANNTIPDAFMYAGNPVANANGWCADISDLVAQDKEWTNIPLPLRESAQIKGKIIAVPNAAYFFGYFCNADLFKKLKIDPPRPGFSVARFKEAVRETTDVKRGIFGLADESSIIEWYPAAANPRLGWYTWDGGKFNLNSKEFKAGVNLAKLVDANGQSYACHAAREIKARQGNGGDAWSAGKAALRFDGTWAVNDYAKLPFKVTFLGIPGGRPCLVPDFLFIAKRCKHLRETYQFVKFMAAYSLEGFTTRLELAKTGRLVVSTIPMIRETKIVDEYITRLKMAGIREVYRKLNVNGYVEGFKILPGYIQARWEYPTNIKLGNTANAKIGEVLLNTYRGGLKIEEVAPQLNAAANECLQIFPQQIDN